MSLSLDRLIRDPVLFRDVNERILEIAPPQQSTVGFLCECSRAGCSATIELTRAEYEWVRSQRNRFLLANGHELAELDRVVHRTSAYALVEKGGAAG